MPTDDLFKRLRNKKPKPEDQASEQPKEGAASQADDKRQHPRPRPAQSAKQREKRLAESFLDNEALTDGLDDQAANALIDWGMDLAHRVVESTRGLPAEQAAAQVEQRGEAARRLMRSARDLALQPPAARDVLPAPTEDINLENTEAIDQEGDEAVPAQEPNALEQPLLPATDPTEELLQQLTRQAREVYGEEALAAQAARPSDLLETIQQAGDAPEDRIAALRRQFEKPTRRRKKRPTTRRTEEQDRDR